MIETLEFYEPSKPSNAKTLSQYFHNFHKLQLVHNFDEEDGDDDQIINHHHHDYLNVFALFQNLVSESRKHSILVCVLLLRVSDFS